MHSKASVDVFNLLWFYDSSPSYTLVIILKVYKSFLFGKKWTARLGFFYRAARCTTEMVWGYNESMTVDVVHLIDLLGDFSSHGHKA